MLSLMTTKNTTFKDVKEHLQQYPDEYPVEVAFKQSIFEDDFVEPGMRAYLVGFDEADSSDVNDPMYNAYFYFGDHYEHNKKLFRRTFYGKEPGELLTCEEAGQYQQHYSVYVMANDKVSKYLMVK